MKMIMKKRFCYRDFIIAIIAIMPIIDAINGYFKGSMLSNIGLIYRLIMIVLATYCVIRWSNKKSVGVVGGISFFFIIHDLLFIVFDGRNNPVSIIWERTLKYIYPFLLTEALITLRKRKKINIGDIDGIFNIFSWLYPILLIIPKIVGVSGLSMYAGSGYKGFFYSGNAISIVMVIMMFVSMVYFYKQPTIINAIRVIINLGIQLLIGAKTNYVFTVCIICYFVILCLCETKQNNYKNLLFIMIIVAVGGYMVINFFADEIARIMSRQNNLYLAYEKDFLRYITSNRSIRIDEQWTMLQSSLVYCMFGMGYRRSQATNFVEMDYFDLLFRYGACVVLFYIVFHLIFLKKALKNQKNYFVMLLIMLAIAFMVGHVFCDAMTGTVLALILANIKICEKGESLEVHNDKLCNIV